ncbi:MAG: hypothetical protein IJU60_06240 [Acholeplasmatales bacterium]|nr:hypothetical protein [Acholeplasmatales bacterium]
MINFHKFTFFDIKRLQHLLDGKNYWLNELNPIKIFLSSVNNSMEISFTNDVCYIRIYKDDIGYCYYPPICSVTKITEALDTIRLDAKEKGIDYQLIYLSEEELFNYEKYNYELYEQIGNYIYLSSELANYKSFSKRHYKHKINDFSKLHPDIFPKKLVKEDLNDVILFLDQLSQNKNSKDYFDLVNYTKNLMEHLYELNLKGLVFRGEKEVYGIIICCEIGNLYDVNYLVAVPGAKEKIIAEFAKLVMNKTKYISLERENVLDATLPKELRIVKYYTNFKYEDKKEEN